MATPWVPKRSPRLLKATYLADQEYLLEETRASKFLYFPGPAVWSVLFGGLTYLTWAVRGGFPTVPQYSAALGRLAGYANHLSKGTLAGYLALLFGVLFLVGLVWIAVRYVRWIRTVYAVTSRRVIIQRGILGRNFDEIPVVQVRGVDVRQTLGQRVLGYGTVRISSEGGSRVGNEDWEGIPKPFRFQKWVENATEAVESPSAAPAVAAR
ncbi:MAG TPA: PH domain-containing protein [Thermoplasmata archaeon]|nr:PH domain-containing protein [Thermoplasmata archaeon]